MVDARFKLLPAPPADLDAVRDAQRAVPLVPGDEDDCCARLQQRCGYETRDVARTWLTFLRALELAVETDAGFKRLPAEPDPDHLRDAFLRRVSLAPEALRALVDAADAGEAPLDAGAVFERVRDAVPTYEEYKNPAEWTDIWRDRTADLLGWLALLDLVERVDGVDDGAGDGAADPGDESDRDLAYRPTERGRAALAAVGS
ncbi:hypothetical protein [Haloparvum sedimenti]|uniref:hypothetical protein n=1 Tax=Haloparvum sedimenti TaxID=1678448 RepID=UPI00071E906A|nr:hypothetical protein [Haloparvum sedimenti]